MKKKTISIALLLILSFALVSQIAMATSLTSATVVLGQTVRIRSQLLGTYSFKAGLLRLVINGEVYEGYCIDINHRLRTGSIKSITDAPDTPQFRRIAYMTAWYDPKVAPNPNFEAASIQGAIWRVFFSPPYGIIWPSSVVTRMNVIYNEANGHNVARQGDTLTLTWEESSSFTIIATLAPVREDVKIIFSTNEEGGSFSNTGTITSTYAFTDASGKATVEYFGDDPSAVTAYTVGGWPKIVDLTNSRYQDLIIIDPFKLTADVITPPQEVSTISGIKFHDRNNDGIKDDGEEVLSSWTITLYKWDENQNQWVQVDSTTTDEYGYYEFSVSEAGTYRVYETLQQGWDQTAPTSSYHEIIINEEDLGNSFDDNDFGNKQTTTLSASKTATGHWTETYTWDIDKSVTPSTLNLFVNDQATIHYTITVTKTELTDRYYVSGTITVKNEGLVDTEGLWIRDVVQAYVDGNWIDITPVTEIVAKGSDIIPTGQTKYYNYEIEFTPYEGATDYRNVAIITITNYSGYLGEDHGQEAIASFSLPDEPVGLANNEVQVSDDETISGGLQLVSSTEPTWPQTISSTTTFEFDKIVKSSTAGTYVIEDTATVTGDAGLLDSADEEVTVNVYALQVTKTAGTSFKRTYLWTIDKSVTPATWDLFLGDSGTSLYTITLTKKGYQDSDWAVSGSISIYNPAPIAATINSISDIVSPDIAATITDSPDFPYTLEAGETLIVHYTADLPDDSSRTNTATVTLQNYDYDSSGTGTASGTTDFYGEANVNFTSSDITEVNKSINVDDTNGGSWTFSDSGSVIYEKTFTNEGTYTNTATIRETGQSDDATVTVNVYELEVTKDASTSFTRTYHWTIDKWADQTELTLAIGQTFLVNYEVTVDATYTDSDWVVSGTITIHNPAPIDAVITDIKDIVSPDIEATINFGSITFPYTLEAGQTLTLTYSVNLPDGSSRINTAIATLQNYNYDYEMNATPNGTTDFSGTANVDFNGATMSEVDESIDVSDDYADFLGTVCYDDAPKTFTYSRTIGSYNEPGTYTVENIASFETDDTGTTDSDSWTVIVNVQQLASKTFVLRLTKNNPQTGYTYYGAVRPAGTQDGWQSVELTGTETDRSGTIPNLTPGLYDWKIYTINETTNTEIVIDSGTENITGKVTNEYSFGVTSLTVTKTVDGIIGNYNITGTITITNTGSYDAIIMSINDIIEYKEPGNNFWVQITPSEFVYKPVITTVAAGQTVTLQYYAIFDASGAPANASWRNTVEVTIFNHPDGIHVFHHTVSFALPT